MVVPGERSAGDVDVGGPAPRVVLTRGGGAAMRDADVRLYDAACRLLEAAQELRATAGEAGPATAIAPTLGCLQAGLEELERAVAALGAAPRAGDAGSAHRLRAALDDLAVTVRLAGRAAGAARAAAAPSPDGRSLVDAP